MQTGDGDKQRDPCGLLVERVLVPPAVVAQLIAVVGEEYDDCVVEQVETLHSIEDLAELSVRKGRPRVVCTHEFASLAVREFVERLLPGAADCLWVQGARVGRLADEFELLQRVHVEVLLRGDEGIVGFVKAQADEEGPVPV